MDEMDAQRLVEQYGDMLYRICAAALRSHADAQDAVQDVFLKYLTKAPAFGSEAHRKAWLITVAVNHCKNVRRNARSIPTDPALLQPGETRREEDGRILAALMEVPEKFRIVLVLHYAEGYKVAEIAPMLGLSASAVKMRLAKGRRLLEEIYRKEYL
ncbi:MAG: RNA polymerase sigma factor [Oscillospiraceae bacterium]|nr:RNA polymerase sigma factor [Oscillospiraceae bacterium]